LSLAAAAPDPTAVACAPNPVAAMLAVSAIVRSIVKFIKIDSPQDLANTVESDYINHSPQHRAHFKAALKFFP
jgi:hypothetical protein